MILDKDIAVFENAVPEDVCNNVIEHYEEMSKLNNTFSRRSQLVSDTQLFHTEINTIRLSLGLDHLRPFLHTFWQCWQEYADYYGVLNTEAELAIRNIKTQKTLPSEGFHQWHWESDSLEHASRVSAFALYLNTVKGGETEFLKQQKRIPAVQGSILIFPGSYTHAHRGNPPLDKPKYLLTGWVEF